MLGFFIMRQYKYNGQIVKHLRTYGEGVVLVELPSGTRETIPASALVELKGNAVTNAADLLAAKPKSTKPAFVEEPGGDVEKGLAIVPEVDNEQLLNINTASQTDIADLKGIGRVNAKRIIRNRPVNGYADLEHLQGLNPDVRVDWDVVQAQIKFL